MMLFRKLRLIEPLLEAVRSEGYTIPTAIQEQAIPYVLEGRDLLGCAQTGTGKTAAFALPILQRLHGHNGADRSHPRVIRALILTPTRELAAQIGESFRVYGRHAGLHHAVVFGGVSQGPQSTALHRGVDILVATPGRLLDLLNQRLLNLRSVEIFVLDEADRMLDMGFIHDIRRVIKQMPSQRQTLMFSATMPREIRGLASTLLHEPAEVTVAAESPAADTVQQALYFVDEHSKGDLLAHLLHGPEMTRALVFTRTKHGADRVARRLMHAEIAAEAIHSNKSQNARMKALDNFKKGATRVLVASDIAARGLDVDDISHVVNYDLPNVAEMYVHRIGRTGRAGAVGQAVSFCSPDQRGELSDIERLLGHRISALSHSIKAASPDRCNGTAAPGSAGRRQAAGPRQGHGPARRDRGGHSLPRTASPERQKADFWSRRRNPRRPASARPGQSARRGG